MERSTPIKSPEQESMKNGDHSVATSFSTCERVGINDLSDEILLLIISRVGTGCFGRRSASDNVHLFNLAACSRRFYQLTEPELYSDFRPNYEGFGHLTKYHCHFLLFLKRILARPDLARSLRRLCSVATPGDDLDQLLPVDSELGDQDWTRIRRVVNETSTSEDEAERWMKAVHLGQWAAVMAVLLSAAPNLEELEITDWSYVTTDYEHLFSVFERARIHQDSCEESPLSMSKLRSVSVSYFDTEGGYSFDQILPFLKLKSVRTFRGHMVQGCSSDYDQRNGPRLNGPPPKLTTKELEFSCSAVDHNDMVIILGLFPQLERFSYQYGGVGPGVGDDATFQPPRMMAALKPFQSCLKDLTLITDEWFDDCDEEKYPIGWLAGFQKLASIRVRASIMIGEDWSDDEDLDHGNSDHQGFAKTQNLVDAVPPALESLALEECNHHIVRHIFELVSQKPWRTPALRNLNLGWKRVEYPDRESPREPTLHPGFTKEEAAKLMAHCDAADIEVAIQNVAPELKVATFYRKEDPADDKTAASTFGQIPNRVQRYFEYPYDGYEECCEQHGCDPETGWQKR